MFFDKKKDKVKTP